ncbi:4Fe-4S dicluster domain-containing protein [Thioalbus denitrificans]|uniref:Ferredoxin-type protein NapG n=1 Tax=Thioalbus denitrificans TaxID=547122 RepID=A0A369CDR4_9GAMM|nr:4Fe-4S dicluster domain-containing protein [Thioalbus denitrificans]RCX30747.1 ferredoxin-type protein NapG [Thioalbus denitrificans]
MTDDKSKEKPVKKPRVLDRKTQEARRRFLRSLGLAAGVVSASLVGFIPVVRGYNPRLRPPGALAEDEFLASCIKCGQCIQVCPVEAIKLTDIMDGFGNGTPHIDARAQACDFSCDGLQCVLACPTGSLSHDTNYPHQVRIGFAELARPDLCLAMQGKGFKGRIRDASFKGLFRYAELNRWQPLPVRGQEFDREICDLCIVHCPIEIRRNQCEAGHPPADDPNQCPPSRAIGLEPVEGGGMRPVIYEGCVGCGACEMVCPVTPAAIVVDMTKNADTVTA